MAEKIQTGGRLYQDNHVKMLQIFASLQPKMAGKIEDIDSSNFTLLDGGPFLIKNDEIFDVTLEVKYELGDEFIETVFSPGWNPDAIKEIKQTSTEYKMLWGR